MYSEYKSVEQVAMDHEEMLGYSAFLIAGLYKAGRTLLLDAWGNGNLELVREVSQYCPYIQKLVHAVMRVTFEYPGIFEYEVVEPFGEFLSMQLLQNACVPDPAATPLHLKKQVGDFLVRNQPPPVRPVIREAIDLVP